MSTLKTASLQHPDASSNTIHLSASGNVGIGTNSPTAKLDLGGNNVAGVSSINGGQVGGRRNLIINGAMQVAQRGTSIAQVNPGTGSFYFLDRFKSQSDLPAISFTVTQAADAPSGTGLTNSLKITIDSAAASFPDSAGRYFRIRHSMEGQSVQPLIGNTCTLSFWVKSSIAGKFDVTFFAVDSSNDHYVAPYTINSANTWEKKVITFTGPDTIGNDNGLGFDVQWQIAKAGSTYQTSSTGVWGGTKLSSTDSSSAIATTTGATWQITGVQLEVGTSATPFEHRSYGEELSLCQRYYWRGAVAAGGCFGGNGTVPLVGFMFPVAMRTTPSGSYISGGIASNGTADYTVTGAYSTFMIRATNQSSRLLFNQSGSASGADGCDLSGAVCAFDAEL